MNRIPKDKSPGRDKDNKTRVIERKIKKKKRWMIGTKILESEEFLMKRWWRERLRKRKIRQLFSFIIYCFIFFIIASELQLKIMLAKDNRFLNPKSSYERILMAPTCRLINSLVPSFIISSVSIFGLIFGKSWIFSSKNR